MAKLRVFLDDVTANPQITADTARVKEELQEVVQQLAEQFEAHASDQTVELIASSIHPNVESFINVHSELADVNKLLDVMHGYTALLKNEFDDLVKLQEDIGVITDAFKKSVSLLQALIDPTLVGRVR